MKKINFDPVNHPTAKVLRVDCWVIIKHPNRKEKHPSATAWAGETNLNLSH